MAELDLLEAKVFMYGTVVIDEQMPAGFRRCGTAGMSVYHAFKLDVNAPPFPLTDHERAIAAETPFVIVHDEGGDGEAFLYDDEQEWTDTFASYCERAGEYQARSWTPEPPPEGWTVLRPATPFDCVGLMEAAIRFAHEHNLPVDRDETEECAIHMALQSSAERPTPTLADWYAKVAEVLATPGATGIIGMTVGRSGDMYTILGLADENAQDEE